MMPKDRGGIGRMGKKHKKLSIFDKHRTFKFNVVKFKLRGVCGEEGAAGSSLEEGAALKARAGAAADGKEGKGGSAIEEAVVGGLGRAGEWEDAAADGSGGSAQKRASGGEGHAGPCPYRTDALDVSADACHVNTCARGTLVAAGSGAGVAGERGKGRTRGWVGREIACGARSPPRCMRDVSNF